MGLLALSSCIDGVESESVTAVRDAKTAELQSIAAMEKAEAEAILALANADAALKAAEAAAQAALAERAAAEVKAQELEQQLIELQKELATLENEEAILANKAEQARLEEEIEREKARQAYAEMKLAELVAELELAKVEAEKAILDAQKDLLVAEETLRQNDEALANAESDAERAEIQAKQDKLIAYYTAYSTALDTYITARQTLNNYKASLVLWENNLADAVTSKEKSIADNMAKIAAYEMQIENLKKYENYTENIDSLRVAYRKANLAYQEGVDEYNALYTEYANLPYDFTVAEEYMDSLSKTVLYKFFVDQEFDYKFVMGKDTLDGTMNLRYQDWFHTSELQMNTNFELVDYEYEGEVVGIYPIRGLEFAAELNYTPEVLAMELYNVVKSAERDSLMAELNAVMMRENYEGDPCYIDYDTFEIVYYKKADGEKNFLEQLEEAKEAYEDEKDPAIKASLYDAYIYLLNNQASQLRLVEEAEMQPGSYSAMLQAWREIQKLYANFDTNLAAFKKDIDKANVLYKECVAEDYELWKVMMDSYYAQQELYAAYYAIALVYSYNSGAYDSENSVELEDSAKAISDQIVDLETLIDELKTANEAFPEVETPEYWVEHYTNLVETQTIKVATAEAALNYAKAALESLTKEETPAEPAA